MQADTGRSEGRSPGPPPGISELFLDLPASHADLPGPTTGSPGHAVDGAPGQLGPYVVTGRWHAEDNGQVLSGHGPAGGVELVLLGAGPTVDPAARDRFVAAVEAAVRAHPGRVVDADLAGPVLWAALRPGSGPAAARPLLDAPLAGAVPESELRGPSFQPYWTGRDATYPAPAQVAPPVPAARGRRWWPVLVVLAVILLVLLAACWPRSTTGGGAPAEQSPAQSDPSGPSDAGSPGPTGSPTPRPTPSRTPAGPSGSPPPDSQAGAAPSQPLRDGPGVSGPSFTTDDETIEMRLAGVPFPFRVPMGWQCRSSDLATGGAVRWVCSDADWTGAGEPPGGAVEVQRCAGPCTSQAWEAMRLGLSDENGWQVVDVGTLVAEDRVQDRQRSRIRMSRIFSGGRDGVVDTHVYVELTSPAEVYPQLQAVANDIRANTS